MWEGDELKGVDFIPEPTDSRILSAVDSSTIGHQDGWRGEVIGWAPEPVVVVSQPRRNICLLYTSPRPRDGLLSRMPSSA